MQPVIDRLKEVISPILWTLGLELIDVVCVGRGPRSVVRVLVDKPGGVTITDCEQAHKALGPALDVADPFLTPIRLKSHLQVWIARSRELRTINGRLENR